MARVINVHATDKAMCFQFEIRREDPEQLRAIMRHIGREKNSSQATILQPISGNGAGSKAKSKTETRHGGKKRPSSIIAFKIIAKQEADKNAQ